MTGKTILITGANGGIGKETAKALALTGAKIIMACRNMESATDAKSKLIFFFCLLPTTLLLYYSQMT
jgi:NAD(P)-dependent dehydrogenase (short-subunit alcohol dehydrogenase family)